VTSACYSPTLGHPIALALLARGDERHGQHVVVHDPVRGEDVLAKVVAPVFHDPSGEKLRADIAFGEALGHGLAAILPRRGAGADAVGQALGLASCRAAGRASAAT
jgi:hypothetical protein